MKRVLVTGLCGFIGRHCLPLLLEEGYEVHGVYRPEDAQVGGDVQWHEADLLKAGVASDLLASAGPTHLLHLAWFTKHGTFWSAPENLQWVGASLALLEAFAAAGGTRVLTVGTCAEYEWSDDSLAEASTPMLPSTLYGTCKHALQLMQAKYLSNVGVSAAWARVFFPYGPGEPPGKLVASIVRALLAGLEAPCSSGEQIRDLVYVKDVAAGLVHMLGSSFEGPVNLATGNPVSVREVAETLGRLVGRTELLRMGALPSRVGDPPRLVGDVSRLHDQLGWRAAYDLERGLTETIAHWRRQRNSHEPQQ